VQDQRRVTDDGELERGDRVRYVGPDLEVVTRGDVGTVVNVNRHDIFVEFAGSGVGAMDRDVLEPIDADASP
jgi:hypothetical protein